ncbi:MAG: hypothetical protein ACTSVV_08540 [Promethearchaeota archaeon]
MLNLDSETKILIQDLGISATHPIIFKKNGDYLIICSISDKKRYNYTIILPYKKFSKIWELKNKRKILEMICSIKDYLEAERGHELAKKYGIKSELIEKVKKYIK